MPESNAAGKIIILNGAPRSGKTSVAKAIQDTFDGVWINLGVDRYMDMIPERYMPGIGLRPGGERPDLEPIILSMYLAMYESIAAHSRRGLHVVVDVDHHDFYSVPLKILPQCARILDGHWALFVGIRCPLDEIMHRREKTWKMGYQEDGAIPPPVLRWQRCVHEPGIYDMEFDTSVLAASAIASEIKERLAGAPPDALRKIRERTLNE